MKPGLYPRVGIFKTPYGGGMLARKSIPAKSLTACLLRMDRQGTLVTGSLSSGQSLSVVPRQGKAGDGV